MLLLIDTSTVIAQDKVNYAQRRANYLKTIMLITRTRHNGELSVTQKSVFEISSYESQQKYEVLAQVKPDTVVHVEEEINLNDDELYDNVLIKINVAELRNIIRTNKSKNYLEIINKAIGNESAKEKLKNWYATNILHLGTSADSIVLKVDGELIYEYR